MNPNSTTVHKILETLRQHFGPLDLDLRDESPKHQGHDHKGEGGHYKVYIVSEAFHGLNRLNRERAVIEVLRPLFDAKLIHALQMTLRTPEETHKS